METALENSKNLKQPPLIYRYELGNCYCMKMEWKKAADLFAPLVEEKNFQVRALCGLQLGACYVMLGERQKAMDIFQRLPVFSTYIWITILRLLSGPSPISTQLSRDKQKYFMMNDFMGWNWTALPCKWGLLFSLRSALFAQRFGQNDSNNAGRSHCFG